MIYVDKILHQLDLFKYSNDGNPSMIHSHIENIPLPDDYLRFIAYYNSQKIKDFIFVLSPFSENESLNFNAANYFIDAYKVLKKQFPEYYPLNIFPDNYSFFPWAITDNGDTFNWLVTNEEPNQWKTIILGSDPAEKELFDMNFSELLYLIISEKIESDILNLTQVF